MEIPVNFVIYLVKLVLALNQLTVQIVETKHIYIITNVNLLVPLKIQFFIIIQPENVKIVTILVPLVLGLVQLNAYLAQEVSIFKEINAN